MSSPPPPGRSKHQQNTSKIHPKTALKSSKKAPLREFCIAQRTRSIKFHVQNLRIRCCRIFRWAVSWPRLASSRCPALDTLVESFRRSGSISDNFEPAAPRTELEMELASGARLAFLFFAGAFLHSGFWPSWFRISRCAKPGRCALARPVAGTSQVRDPRVDISHHFELPTTFFEFSRRSWAQRYLHLNSASCTIREWNS